MITYDVEPNGQEWLDLHIGIPTSSAFDKLVTPAKGAPSKQIESYARQLAVDQFSGVFSLDSWGGNEWTDRGHLYQGAASAWYQNTFEDRVVTQIGFMTNDAGTAGSSPDNLVDNDGLLEIKCLKGEKHLAVIQYYQIHGKAPNDYFMQPQGQMLVGKKDWCDLLFFHPVLPKLIIRQEPDLKIQGTLEVQIEMVNALKDTLLAVMESM